MRDLLYVEDVEQAAALLKPARLDVLRQMASETTCTDVAAALGSTPQKVYYHVKALEQANLVERVTERRVRGIVEGLYRARARSYWLSPRLVGEIGGSRVARDSASLGYLISLAEEVQEDIGQLAALPVSVDAADTPSVPSLGLSAHIELPNLAARTAFLRDVQETFQLLAERHGASTARTKPRGKGRATFRIALACYPDPNDWGH